METKQYDQQIIIISGINNIARATLGLAMALSNVHTGMKIVVFLAMEGVFFAAPKEGRAKYIKNYETIDHYIKALLKEDVTIEACITCVEIFCPEEERQGKYKKLKEGIVYAGLSSAAIRSLDVPTLIF